MQLSDFDYHLPKEFIAQTPLPERDQSKLMVLNRAARAITHHTFFELPDLLDSNSVLVFNESRVIPARLQFKIGSGNAEILLLKPLYDNLWECLVRPGEKFQPGFKHAIAPDFTFKVKGISEGLRLSPAFLGTHTRPSLRKLSLIKVNLL